MKPPVSAAPEDLAAAIKGSNAGKHFKRNLILALVVLAVGGGAWFWWSRVEKAKNQVTAYVTETLKRGEISLTITATGNLAPTTEVTVGSELSGTTLEVYVDFNDHVTKGKPLAKLDTSKLAQQTESSRATVRSAQAKVAQAEATVKESAATLARQQELHRISVSSTSDLEASIATADRARADVLSAQALVGEAEAQVRINENDLSKSIIKSPIDGIVLTRSIEPGQTVAASFTAPQLFIIAEKLERMKLEVSIAEADIGRVAKGQSATFTVDAWPDRAYTAIVSTVSYGSVVKDNVVTYEADLEVSNDDLSLRPGMTATADIRMAESTNVFLVPTAALRFVPASAIVAAPSAAKKSFVQSLIPMPTRRSGRPTGAEADGKSAATAAHIWVLRNGHPESIAVQIGLSDGRNTEVSGAGLTEGMLIVLRANTPLT
ncbi:MAG: efflux RND transporter periplasmic adaptor subunit [Verrucomicrobiota bacterium]